MQIQEIDKLTLELGDIIKIASSSNTDLNNNIFYITYIDNEKCKLINVETKNQIILNITDSEFDDKSIETIEIINRSREIGYARQNNLVVDRWITIVFGGDIPTTINGKITNLDEDMIELTLWPTSETIYIDFAYKGIPENLPIEKIMDFKDPTKTAVVEESKEKTQSDFETDGDALDEDDEEETKDEEKDNLIDEFYQESKTIRDIEQEKEDRNIELIQADDIVFGESFEDVEETIIVSESEKRFTLQNQANDLLDDLLSTVPSIDRTKETLNNLHKIVERFKELRQTYSEIDNKSNNLKIKKKPKNFKPIIKNLLNLDTKIKWLLPICKTKKLIYDFEIDEDDADVGIKPVNLSESQNNSYDIQKQYKENTIPSGDNKYLFLNKNINNYFVPFENSELDKDILISKSVNTDINTIISNVDDYVSYTLDGNVNNEFTKKYKGYNIQLSKNSFIPQKFLNKNTYKSVDEREITINDSEKINITGFLTLSHPIIKYSNINLPKTSIYDKSRLNLIPFYYKNILKNKSLIKTNILDEETINKSGLDLKVNDKYLTEFESYLFSEDKSLVDRDSNTYENFLNNMFPNTLELFNTLSKNLSDSTSIYTILKYLQPFMIFSEDLTFKVYEAMVKLIEKNILELKSKMIQNQKEFSTYINYNYNRDIGFKNSYLFNSLNNDFVSTILENYSLQKETTSEFIRKLLILDNGNLYMNALSLTDIELFINENIDEKIQNKINELDNNQEPEKTEDCKNFVIAKAYIDFDELNEDNDNPDVYFDVKYDETRYDIIDELSEQQESMDKEEFNEFLIEHLVKNVGLSIEKASIDADALINKKKRVNTNDYAYIVNDSGENIFYKRTSDNKWLHDKELDGMPVSKEMFCNLKKSCISINKECGDIQINKEEIKKQLIKDMLSNFENETLLDNDKLITKIKSEINYNLIRIMKLSELKNHQDTKYDKVKKAIANSLEDRNITISEYTELRDLILSQDDFVEKQNNIIKFIETYCRPAQIEKNEEPEWFYCIKTNTKLLPTFYEKLAKSFLIGNYKEQLEIIASERGELSDDGDKVVDKYSGFYIKNIEFDSAEGYDEGGYKIVSRAVIDQDIADQMTANSSQQLQNIKSKRGMMILNVLTTLQKQMNISIASEVEFIIYHVENMLITQLPSEQDYNNLVKMEKKNGRKLPSYEQKHDDILIYMTLSFFLVITQTITPPVKTSLTFRGCGPKSFTGYPFEGEGDFSGLKYLSCVALRLSSSTRPWNRIPKLTRKKGIETLKKMIEKLKKITDKNVLTKPEIQEKIEKRKLYNMENKDMEIYHEFDVNNWDTFLPPLSSIKIENLQTIGPTFKSTLESYMKSGDMEQFKLINKLKGKIKLFSLSLQEKIQNAVNDSVLLLENIYNELLVSNACCNEGNKHTLLYFIEKENSILDINNTVYQLENINNICKKLTHPHFLVHNKSTKLQYPTVIKGFSENIIYKFIIKHCEFNSGLEISEKYKLVCGENTSAFKNTDSLSDKIATLKSEGKNYTIENFIYLMDLINKDNKVDIDLNKQIYSEKDIFMKYITNEGIISNLKYSYSLIDFLKILNDDIKNKNLNNLSGFLKDQTNTLLSKLTEFLIKNPRHKKINSILNNLSLFKTIGDDVYISTQDETSTIFNTLMKTFIINILKIYPKIIENKINHEVIPIPEHWKTGSQKISATHMKDIKNIIDNDYNSFNKYNDNKSILKLFEVINSDPLVNVILDLINYLPFEANSKINGEFKNNTLLNGKITKDIMFYLFLMSINIYIVKIPDIIKSSDVVMETESKIQGSDEFMLGEKENTERDVTDLLCDYMFLLQSNKDLINITNKEINEDVLKSKEKEKAKITKRLGDLSVDERKVEDIMKTHRLDKWGVGQTRALYVYDKDQYDKERAEIESDALNDYKLNQMDNITERNKEIFKMDFLEEQNANNMVENEINNGIMAIADDDDFDDDREEMGYASYMSGD